MSTLGGLGALGGAAVGLAGGPFGALAGFAAGEAANIAKNAFMPPPPPPVPAQEPYKAPPWTGKKGVTDDAGLEGAQKAQNAAAAAAGGMKNPLTDAEDEIDKQGKKLLTGAA